MSIYEDRETPAESAVVVTQNVMVPMRDGIRLATDIYRPEHQTDPLPVILQDNLDAIAAENFFYPIAVKRRSTSRATSELQSGQQNQQ